MQDCICREVDFLKNSLDILRKSVGDIIRRGGLCLNRGSGHVGVIGAKKMLDVFSNTFLSYVVNPVDEGIVVGNDTANQFQQNYLKHIYQY